jgi:3-oxoacyl-[acyl-carrier-protein] synthase II
MSEVLVTGLGAVTCYGRGVEALWAAMSAARRRQPDRVVDPDGHMNLPLIHRVPDGSTVDNEDLGPAAALAVAAAEEAIEDAGLEAGLPTSRAGVVLGSCMGETASRERGRSAPEAGGRPPFELAATVADRLGLYGAHVSLSNACAAGGFALSIAADMISEGEADVVVAGGADAYSRVAWACFDRLGAVDPVRCRPFDRHRRGTILSEGAGVLVLESRAHAERRGARVYAAFGGYGWSCDAHHLTAPEPSGRHLVRAMRDAMARGGVAGRVGCVIPHGTGTRLNDVAESQALRAVFGPTYERTPLYSLKALIGHTGGASAALAAVAAARMLRERYMPPNVPLDEQDPECAVHLPHTGVTPLTALVALVNAYAFGGNNTSFVLTEAA